MHGRIHGIALLVVLVVLLAGLAACGDEEDDAGVGEVPAGPTATARAAEPSPTVSAAETGTPVSSAGTPTTSTRTAASPPAGSPAAAGATEEVTIGLTFVPNIQFSPFYVAIEKGYYEDAGLEVTLNHHAVGADQFGALVAGQEDMLMAAGDETLMARSQGVPLVYVAEIYRDYPVALIVPADSDIQSVADLAGHTIGIPGEYGANYIGLLALLDSAGLTEEDVSIESVGFTQASALLAGHVDAVMGYINNEPIQLEKAGMEVRTFPVGEVKPLVSNGLVALEEYLNENPAQAEAVIAATLQGVQYVIDHPEEAVEISREYVPTLEDRQQAADALAVLEATIPLWTLDDGEEFGETDPAAWQEMASFLQEHGLLAGDVEVEQAYSNAYLPRD